MGKAIKWLKGLFGTCFGHSGRDATAVADRLCHNSQGRGSVVLGREHLAASKIQIVFRGFLARKALRALKGLVKFQALVRGYLVRRQVSAIFHSMQALMRAAQRTKGGSLINNQNSQFHARMSLEKFEESRSGNIISEENAEIVERDTGRPKSRSRRRKTWASSDPCYDLFTQVVPSWASDSAQQPDYYPNYMATTQSFKAKLRAKSALKQRPELGPKVEKMPLSEMVESRSGVKMRSHVQKHKKKSKSISRMWL